MNLNINLEDKENLIEEIFNFKIVLILLLAIVPLFSAGFDHNIIYWILIISIPITIITLFKNENNLNYNKIDKILILFLVWSGLSIFWSINYVRSIIEFLQLFCFLIVFLLVKNISKNSIKIVIKTAYITGIGISVFGILEYIIIKGSRITSTFGNPNPLGIYLAMLFLFLLGYALQSEDFDNKRYFSIEVILLTGLILTASRGSILALIFSIPIVFIKIKKENLKKSFFHTIAVIGISIVISNLIIFITPFIQEGLGEKNLIESVVRVESGIPTSVTGRLEFWKVALNLVKYNPIKGFGLGTFFSAYYLEYNVNEWYSRFAHNHYLQILVEQGIVGLLLFVSFISISLKNIVINILNNDNNKYTVGALSASLAFLMHIFIDFSWNFPAVSILFFAFLGIALRKSDLSESNERKFKETKNKTFPKKIILLILTFIFILNFWQFSSNKVFEKGVNLIEENPEGALEIIEFGNKYYPLNSRGFYYESKIYFDRYKENKDVDNLNKAIKLAKHSIALAKYDGFLNNYLGNIYLESEDYVNSEKYLVKGVEYGAYNLRYYIDLSTSYMFLDDIRIEDEKELLLKVVDLIEPALKRAKKTERPVRLIEAAVIHHRLAIIYEKLEKESLKEFHTKQEQDYLKEAFNQ